MGWFISFIDSSRLIFYLASPDSFRFELSVITVNRVFLTFDFDLTTQARKARKGIAMNELMNGCWQMILSGVFCRRNLHGMSNKWSCNVRAGGKIDALAFYRQIDVFLSVLLLNSVGVIRFTVFVRNGKKTRNDLSDDDNKNKQPRLIESCLWNFICPTSSWPAIEIRDR